MRRLFAIIAAVAFMAVAVGANAEEIKVGLLSDLSGPTSAVGQPYAEGVKAGAAYVNDNRRRQRQEAQAHAGGLRL